MLRTLISLVLIVVLARWKWDELRALVLRYVDLDWDYEIWTPGTSNTSTATPDDSVTDEVPVPDSATVYVTASGSKYHRAGCQSLGQNPKKIPVTEALESYSPCGRCKPVS